MPNSVQIKGSPDLRFSAKFDMGDYLKDFFNEDDFKQKAQDIVLLDCEKTSVVTYLVYMKLYDQVLTLPFPNTVDFTATGSDKNLVPTPGSGYEKLEVPALDFGEFLDGFSFNQNSIVSKLYLSGSPIIEGLSVELKINGGTPLPPKKGNRASGLKGKTTYDKTELPSGGTEIDLPFDGNKLIIEYRIFVKEKDTIKKEWMTNPSIMVELAVWFPFEFIADNGGAELKLPDDLFGEGDLFGREDPGGGNTVTEMLESLSFAMKMNTNPFTGASLIVESKGIKISNPIRGASLEFALNEQNMKAINSPANFPFVPKLKLVFNRGGILSFPRNFVITEIAFKTKLNHTIDLSGGIN
jgi:hypothetical protein